MNALICEMCGSTDIIKQDGVFVCQHCGCKYSVEEAKKMLVTGTVKIDNSDHLRNLYKSARYAKDANDAPNAEKYYSMIQQEDPNSWEAAFYSVYFKAMQTKILFIASAATSIQHCLKSVFPLLKENCNDLGMQKAAVVEISSHTLVICSLLESNARNHFRKFANESPSNTMSYFNEYHSRTDAIYNVAFTLGNLIEQYFPDDTEMQKAAVIAWETGVQYWIDHYLMFDDASENKEKMDRLYGDRIRKYKSDYVIPDHNWNGYPNAMITFMRRQENRISSSSGNSSSEGCYIATAVYGSYDCPQVWTLRRFRDYKLAKSWYGRAFIHTYYAISPTVVKWFGDTDWFKKIWREKLDHMVEQLQSEGFENTPYQDRPW